MGRLHFLHGRRRQLLGRTNEVNVIATRILQHNTFLGILSATGFMTGRCHRDKSTRSFFEFGLCFCDGNAGSDFQSYHIHTLHHPPLTVLHEIILTWDTSLHLNSQQAPATDGEPPPLSLPCRPPPSVCLHRPHQEHPVRGPWLTKGCLLLLLLLTDLDFRLVECCGDEVGHNLHAELKNSASFDGSGHVQCPCEINCPGP